MVPFFSNMQFSETSRTIVLDIVAIVAVLGGGSVVRVAQASGLTWQHIFPRLVPAPQAFIKDKRDERLPTERGTVVGVYSGNLRPELNFFAALLHPKPLEKNQVELVEVRKKKAGKSVSEKKIKVEGISTETAGDPAIEKEDDPMEVSVKKAEDTTTQKNVYGAKEFGFLCVLSLFGLTLSIVISCLSFRYDDMFAFAATILLSVSSTVTGFASWWKLDLKEHGPRKDREDKVPAGDVVIHYARLGAFRIVRCDEKISELYFRIEYCDYILGEAGYRLAWLGATVLLASGLICLKNSTPEFQMAFAASFILLNVFYWICSALNPTDWHWWHEYEVTTRKWEFQPEDTSFRTTVEAKTVAMVPANDIEAGAINPLKKRSSSFGIPLRWNATTSISLREPERKYTDALWPAIALVGHSRWVPYARVAPDNSPWKQWIEEAGNIAAGWWQDVDPREQHQVTEASRQSKEVLTAVIDPSGTVKLPAWDYQKRLSDLFAAQSDYEKRAPNWPELRKLMDAGYFPKMKAVAEPLQKLSETADEAAESQGASTAVESIGTEQLQTSSTSTHLGFLGTRLRPVAAGVRSRSKGRQRVLEAEESPTEARMKKAEEGSSSGPDSQSATEQPESQIARKEKAGV